jgi:energy-coupling factor transporter ATP-binding protein EcfA2
MVATVKNTLSSLQTISQPHFVELVGPAGAGKSTLARSLCQHNGKIMIGTEIALRNVEQYPIFVRSIPLILSSLFSRARDSRPWTWDEIKFLIYLKQWNQVLEIQAHGHPGIILLDHGPIFKLATLHAFGPSWLRSVSADAWWKELFQQWAALLDLIVWLDAPDTLLETRINARSQKHEVKGKTGQEVVQFLNRYRSSYRYVLSGLAASGGPTVIQFDTSQSTLKQITGKVLVVCQRATIGV